MYRVQNLTADAKQIQTLILPDGTQINLNIRFIDMQKGWFITALTYGAFVISNLRIVNSPNMLYQWKNQIPFGLACISSGILDPSLQADLLSGYSKIYILTEDEVLAYQEFLSG